MTLYAGVLVLTCLAVILSGSPAMYATAAAFWIPLIAVANLSELSMLPELELDASLASIVIVAAAVLHPPSAVALFVLVGMLYRRELRGEAPVVMALFNRAQVALSGAVASVCALAVARLLGEGAVVVVLASFAAFVGMEIANDTFLAGMLMVRRGRSFSQAVREVANPFPRFALNAGVSATLSLLLIFLVRDVGRWAVVLMAIPLWLSHSAQQSARTAQDRAEELAARVRELEMLNLLSGRLLTVRSRDDVPAVVAPAFADLGVPTVRVDPDGDAAGSRPARGAPTDTARADGGQADSEPDDQPEVRASIPGAEPAAIVAEVGDQAPPQAVLDAAAALVGLTLTRLELEAELAETERARTALTGQILEEATRERSRIALGVHDDVLPLFAAAQMKIDMLDAVVDADPTAARAMGEAAMQAVTDGITELRDTLEALRRSTLVPGTLVVGLRKVLSELQTRTGVRGTLAAPDPLPELPYAVELLAFETARGCIANVEKHAAATSLRVELDIVDSKLVVHMRDDGRGFDPSTIGRRSHGLALMRQRAELARGSFDISNHSEGGTVVRLEVPTW